MQILEVNTPELESDFLEAGKIIYQDDLNWICPLDAEVKKVFDAQQNSFFQHGKCKRWVLKANNSLIGRIAAFINHEKAHQYAVPTGGIGFFECIDEQAAADMLFNQARTWLEQEGMQATEGPINFGENDSFWGLLIEGFSPPSFGMNYHKPYYHKLFKAYGFETVYEQLTNHLDLRIPFPERFTKIANWVAQKPGYSFEYFDPKNKDKYISDLMEIYNDGWKDFKNFVPINRETLEQSFKSMEPIMDPKLIWFAYVNGEPASFVVIIPDANQLIKGFNGKLGLIEKLRFVYRRWKGVSRMRAIVMGTKTEFQKLGLESSLFIKLKEYVIPMNQYEELELSWVGDFNEKMISIHEATGAKFGKKHVTMLKKFE